MCGWPNHDNPASFHKYLSILFSPVWEIIKPVLWPQATFLDFNITDLSKLFKVSLAFWSGTELFFFLNIKYINWPSVNVVLNLSRSLHFILKCYNKNVLLNCYLTVTIDDPFMEFSVNKNTLFAEIKITNDMGMDFHYCLCLWPLKHYSYILILFPNWWIHISLVCLII